MHDIILLALYTLLHLDCHNSVTGLNKDRCINSKKRIRQKGIITTIPTQKRNGSKTITISIYTNRIW